MDDRETPRTLLDKVMMSHGVEQTTRSSRTKTAVNKTPDYEQVVGRARDAGVKGKRLQPKMTDASLDTTTPRTMIEGFMQGHGTIQPSTRKRPRLDSSISANSSIQKSPKSPGRGLNRTVNSLRKKATLKHFIKQNTPGKGPTPRGMIQGFLSQAPEETPIVPSQQSNVTTLEETIFPSLPTVSKTTRGDDSDKEDSYMSSFLSSQPSQPTRKSPRKQRKPIMSQKSFTEAVLNEIPESPAQETLTPKKSHNVSSPSKTGLRPKTPQSLRKKREAAGLSISTHEDSYMTSFLATQPDQMRPSPKKQRQAGRKVIELPSDPPPATILSPRTTERDQSTTRSPAHKSIREAFESMKNKSEHNTTPKRLSIQHDDDEDDDPTVTSEVSPRRSNRLSTHEKSQTGNESSDSRRKSNRVSQQETISGRKSMNRSLRGKAEKSKSMVGSHTSDNEEVPPPTLTPLNSSSLRRSVSTYSKQGSSKRQTLSSDTSKWNTTIGSQQKQQESVEVEDSERKASARSPGARSDYVEPSDDDERNEVRVALASKGSRSGVIARMMDASHLAISQGVLPDDQADVKEVVSIQPVAHDRSRGDDDVDAPIPDDEENADDHQDDNEDNHQEDNDEHQEDNEDNQPEDDDQEDNVDDHQMDNDEEAEENEEVDEITAQNTAPAAAAVASPAHRAPLLPVEEERLATPYHLIQSAASQVPKPGPRSRKAPVARASVASKKGKGKTPSLPPTLTKSIFSHFLGKTASKETMEEVEKVCESFWKQTADDLEAYANHAHKKKIDEADIELLMKRQGFVDKHSMYRLVEEYLPLQYQKEIIPCASAGNVVTPKNGLHL